MSNYSSYNNKPNVLFALVDSLYLLNKIDHGFCFDTIKKVPIYSQTEKANKFKIILILDKFSLIQMSNIDYPPKKT